MLLGGKALQRSSFLWQLITVMLPHSSKAANHRPMEVVIQTAMTAAMACYCGLQNIDVECLILEYIKPVLSINHRTLKNYCIA